MFQRIVVPLDGSDCAERAIPMAARIARACGGSIIFVRVILPPVESGKYAARHSITERERAEASSYLVDVMMRHGNELVGIDTDIGVATGLIAPALCSVARSEQADMIVMCGHGETGFKRWFFGSIAQELIHQSPVPVLALHERGVRLPAQFNTRPVCALVALDGSPLSESALGPAARLVSALAAPGSRALHLLRVVDLPGPVGRWKSQSDILSNLQVQAMLEAEVYLEGVKKHLHNGRLAKLNFVITSSVVVNANVAGEIITLAEHTEWNEYRTGYDLIAMATHGRTGLKRLVMGSVTERVLGATRLPLLMMRPQSTGTREKVGVREKRG
jgi:nucleotide-binding universal stress UspA family protein